MRPLRLAAVLPMLPTLAALAGCAAPDSPPLPVHYEVDWPEDAQLVEVAIEGDEAGRFVLRGGFAAAYNRWVGTTSGPGPHLTDTHGQPTVDGQFFLLSLGRADQPDEIHRYFGFGAVNAVQATLSASLGAPAGAQDAEVTIGQFGNGEGGIGISVSYSETEFTVDVLPGERWSLLMAATNRTGFRAIAESTLRVEADPHLRLAVRHAADPLAASAEDPRFGADGDAGLHTSGVAQAAFEQYGASALEVRSDGPLFYYFAPWLGLMPDQRSSALYGVAGPEVSYTARWTADGQAPSAECLSGCGPWPAAYLLDLGLGPAGDYRFSVDEARCAMPSRHDCVGMLLAFDLARLGPAEALLPVA